MRPRVKSHVYNAIKEDKATFNESLEKMICREEATRQHISYLNSVIARKDIVINRLISYGAIGWGVVAAVIFDLFK